MVLTRGRSSLSLKLHLHYFGILIDIFLESILKYLQKRVHFQIIGLILEHFEAFSQDTETLEKLYTGSCFLFFYVSVTIWLL